MNLPQTGSSDLHFRSLEPDFRIKAPVTPMEENLCVLQAPYH